MNESESSKPKPMGWLVGLAVLLITLGVIAGLIGITVVAKRKQRYRIDADPVFSPALQTNGQSLPATNHP